MEHKKKPEKEPKKKPEPEKRGLYEDTVTALQAVVTYMGTNMQDTLVQALGAVILQAALLAEASVGVTTKKLRLEDIIKGVHKPKPMSTDMTDKIDAFDDVALEKLQDIGKLLL